MTEEVTYRIGEVAERLGVTPRTIRYYQELGLVHGASGRAKGAHRVFTEAEIARLADLIRLRNLLGLSLEELTLLADAEEARAELRGRWAEASDDAGRRAILERAIPHVRRQLELVRGRRETIEEFERQLASRLAELEADLAAAPLSRPPAAPRRPRTQSP
jgi:MerR family transcriptional regulator, repressor of the yfmOP operon